MLNSALGIKVKGTARNYCGY